MSIATSAERRYAAKAFDPEKTLSSEQVNDLKKIMRLSPSSINLQAWHFFIISSDDAKERLIKCCQGKFEYNAEKIKGAPLTVIFCAKTEATKAQITQVLDQEFADGRFENDTIKSEREALLCGNIERLNEKPNEYIQSWLDKQTYIALGATLLAAADMGIDSVPVEGFDKALTDEEFSLLDKGYHSTVIACFGHHSDGDFNAKLPKSRLPESQLFTEL